ncbi:hypothetical protein [Streptomyces sp. NPDC057002]|uniref:hypothetical protein n=1 Tax=Streptomyces sp. NPDC057002 TaxID=3345992 RepID=UPI003639750D
MKQRSPELTAPIRNFSLQLSPTPRGARLARLLAAEQLRSWESPLDPARQVVAELSANAVTHGRVPGHDFPTDHWGVTPGLPPRKTVWAEIGLAPEPKNLHSGGAGCLPEGPQR